MGYQALKKLVDNYKEGKNKKKILEYYAKRLCSRQLGIQGLALRQFRKF